MQLQVLLHYIPNLCTELCLHIVRRGINEFVEFHLKRVHVFYWACPVNLGRNEHVSGVLAPTIQLLSHEDLYHGFSGVSLSWLIPSSCWRLWIRPCATVLKGFVMDPDVRLSMRFKNRRMLLWLLLLSLWRWTCPPDTTNQSGYHLLNTYYASDSVSDIACLV